MKKYEITDIAHPDNPNLHRIRAPSPVKMQLSAAMQSLQITPLQEVMPMSARTPP